MGVHFVDVTEMGLAVVVSLVDLGERRRLGSWIPESW